MSDGKSIEMTYDASGNRLLKQVLNADGSLLQGEAFVAGEVTLTNEGNGFALSAVSITTPNGVEGRVNAGGSREFYITDHLGSTRQVVGENGQVVEQNWYEAFGKLNPLTVASVGSKEKFTGKQLDERIDLYNFPARSYDGDLGVWTSLDPAEQFANGYTYTGNGANPLVGTDPDGAWFEAPWDGANIAMGVGSFMKNVAVGNYGGAIVDAVGTVLDIGALATPVPGGAGTAIKVYRAKEIADATLKAGKVAEARKKTLQVARQNGVDLMWKNEIKNIRNGKPSRKWTPEQMKDILEGRRPKSVVDGKTIEGAHIKSVKKFPEEAGNPDNIIPKSFTEHRKANSGEHSKNPRSWTTDNTTTP